MSDIQTTWLEKEASKFDAPEDAIGGAKLLQDKIFNWVLVVQDEGIANAYAISAMWELVERIEEWCGRSNASINTRFGE